MFVTFFTCVKDERNQVLIAYLWIRQTWHDAYLKWNKEDYDGLEVIHIPSSLVWRPDLVLYNKYIRIFPSTNCFSNLSLYVNIWTETFLSKLSWNIYRIFLI